jgi:hypothetical protein
MADTDKPRVFTRTRERDGKKLTQIAHDAASVVKFQFDGWAEVTGAEASKAVGAADRDAAAAEKAAAKTDAAAATAKK